MGLLDFIIFNKDKKHFKQNQRRFKNTQQSIPSTTDLVDTDFYKANFKLIEAAKEFTRLKQELIENGINVDAETDPYRITLIINDFIHSTLEQLPAGVILPIQTSFVKEGKEQTLILGRDIISSSQFIKKSGSKPKHGILRHKYIALFMDKDKAPDIFNPGITNRITIEDEYSVYLINLLTDDFLESPTQSCRFSNIEFNFSNWENSLNQIRNIGQTPNATELLKMLHTLDQEITEQITDFLKNRNNEMEAELNQVFN